MQAAQYADLDGLALAEMLANKEVNSAQLMLSLIHI